MNSIVIFLIFGIFALSQAATSVIETKNDNRQSDIQVTKPTGLDSTGVRNLKEDLRAAYLKLQANQIEGSASRDEKQAPIQSQVLSSQKLHSTGQPLDLDITQDQPLNLKSELSPATAMKTVSQGNVLMSEISINQQEMPRNSENQNQMFNSNQFLDDKQQVSEDQRLYNSRDRSNAYQQQGFPARDQAAQNQQQFYNNRQPQQQQAYHFNSQSQDQQQGFPARDQAMSQQQFYNNRQPQSYHFMAQSQDQQLFPSRQQSHEQQKTYSNVQAVSMNDQLVNLNHRVSVHQSQIRTDSPQILSQDMMTQIQAKGVRNDVQPSAFDNRERGLTLPRGTSVHSSGSVVVSGLKNLPMLPAMVYNSGPVPSSHAIVYGRDGYFKGSASLHQNMQTPYVRYVYSHIL